jgi:accessory gene regulator B
VYFLERLSNKIACFLIRSGSASDEIRDIIVFGAEASLSLIINLIFTLIIGFIIGVPLELLVFIIPFSALRMLSGGFHAKTFLGCVLMSLIVILLVSALIITDIGIAILPLTMLFILVANTIVFLFAPVIHVNHPMDCEAIKQFKKRSRYTVVGCSALCLVLLALNCMEYAYYISIGMLVSSGSTLTAFIYNKKEDQHNERKKQN